MAIEKYTTDALVVESFDQGEHDRVYKIFTRDFGLISANAKSVRKLESKLRAHLLPRTMSLVTLVQGREVWRIVGAEQKKESHPMIYEVTILIKRFIRGEGAHVFLYDRLVSFLNEAIVYDSRLSRILLYYIFLVDLGYADCKAIGAKNSKEYDSWSVNDLYTHLLLADKSVRTHIHEVLKEMQL